MPRRPPKAATDHVARRRTSPPSETTAAVPASRVAAQAEVTCLPYRRNVVVAVGTDVMGRGSDELGHVLLKGFLYALAHQPELPQTILFYNGGAHLTVQGSDSLEDLQDIAYSYNKELRRLLGLDEKSEGQGQGGKPRTGWKMPWSRKV